MELKLALHRPAACFPGLRLAGTGGDGRLAGWHNLTQPPAAHRQLVATAVSGSASTHWVCTRLTRPPSSPASEHVPKFAISAANTAVWIIGLVHDGAVATSVQVNGLGVAKAQAADLR